ncbi:hypothetical protein F8271_26665 [Micromonospora sp. ALFpr18c]|uniref:maleylpyruvate isomerase N-terminal domain-containing protein n=1 Tax=Micromonospora sp. ALFpr18c TaxID=1458665 RepID=UPI00124B0D12|nr:maleylpyruvate isomerase N-terminal domain-containing protein [Micromonospora sp. ALFpr18c]KAB1931733.1 hypothetical protein F8271_26665 [Micromonospora sp. ALFpr18c]
MATQTSDLLAAAAPRTVDVVRGVADDQLDLPTPCRDYVVRDLLNHLFEVVVNFQELAVKRPVEWAEKPDHLGDGWRDRFAVETDRLVAAWSPPGRTHPRWRVSRPAWACRNPSSVEWRCWT